jgi:hypothetical protein
MGFGFVVHGRDMVFMKMDAEEDLKLQQALAKSPCLGVEEKDLNPWFLRHLT